MQPSNQLILIKKLNLMDNKKLILWLNLASLPLLLVFGLLFSQLASTLTSGTLGGMFSFLDTVILFIALLILIIIHEGVHGLFFKCFNPAGKVKFGFKNGLAYATSPNSYYSKKTYTWISLAPFTLISIVLTILYIFGVLAPFLYISLATLHASSCVGDFYFIWLLIRSPKNCLVEDTEQGINFYNTYE